MEKCSCPVDTVAHLLGRRWVIVLLRDLFVGRKYFKEFLAANPTLSNKVLAQKLKEMVADKIIRKKENYYVLSAQGKRLKPILREMVIFGEKYCDKENYAKLLDKFTT